MRLTKIMILATYFVAQPAFAAPVYEVKASGNVSSVFGGPGNFVSDGRVAVGDPFSVTLDIDTSSVISSITNVGMDSSAVYSLPISYSYTFGSFTATGTLNSADLIINRNHDIGSGLVEDGIAFVGFLPATTNSPFVLSTPSVYSSFQFDGFDFGHSTLSGVGLDQLSSFSAFPNYVAQLAFTNSTFDTSVIAQGNITSSSFAPLIAAVPEPATWAMMLIGFGAIGATMRRKRKVVVEAAGAA